jgi:AcrR family transcriptional regulator
MEMGNPGPRRLSRHDWAMAALHAIGEGGVDAVAVEPLAAKLGATKGSFYWHFRSRDELIEAALEVWEEHWTAAVIEFLEREPDPAERLRMLMNVTFQDAPRQREIEVALLAHPSNPVANAAVRRVMNRRLDYMAAQFRAIGWSREEATDRSMLLGYLYSGYLLTSSLKPTPGRAKGSRYTQIVFESLIEPPPRAKPVAAPRTRRPRERRTTS